MALAGAPRPEASDQVRHLRLDARTAVFTARDHDDRHGHSGLRHLGRALPVSHLADHVAVGCDPLRDDSADLLHRLLHPERHPRICTDPQDAARVRAARGSDDSEDPATHHDRRDPGLRSRRVLQAAACRGRRLLRRRRPAGQSHALCGGRRVRQGHGGRATGRQHSGAGAEPVDDSTGPAGAGVADQPASVPVHARQPVCHRSLHRARQGFR